MVPLGLATDNSDSDPIYDPLAGEVPIPDVVYVHVNLKEFEPHQEADQKMLHALDWMIISI